MSKYYCNPLKLTYRYQFNQKDEGFIRNREAADPSLISFKGRYYLFASMSRAFWSSLDLIDWQMHEMKNVPVYDYAPDVRVIGKYMYFSASRDGEICDFFRTENPESGEFEKIDGTFAFWDPNLFVDDDDRIYFYWGCSNMTPIYGVELDSKTMNPLGEKVELIGNHKTKFGYERVGENHHYDVKKNNVWLMMRENFAQQMGCKADEISDLNPIIENLPEEQKQIVQALLTDNPYIEGAWMTKHNGRYYLQYACTGTEYNIYGDGVYEAKSPLGPFEPAMNNPYSYNPGGFLPGAGHGSTLEDEQGRWWHTATMRISANHAMERRVGLWPAGFDEDEELFCNQRYGDWPRKIDENTKEPWSDPEWMLLSYGKKATATSGNNLAENVIDENVQTWWKADSNESGEWVCLDLGEKADVRAIQINFADDSEIVSLPEGKEAVNTNQGPARYIEETIYLTQWLLEGSEDGENWSTIEDKTQAQTDYAHDLVLLEEGISVRYLRLTITKLPYDVAPCVSGLRIFGHMNLEKPQKAGNVSAVRTSGMDMKVSWKGKSNGASVQWGHAKDKLYHSYLIYNANELEIGALMEDTKDYYVRVDLFNEGGITEGDIIKVV